MKIYQVWIKGKPNAEECDMYLSAYSTMKLALQAKANYEETDQTDSTFFIEEEVLDSRQVSK